MPLLDHFGLIAPFYDRVLPPGDLSRLIEMLDLPIQGALLDAGGGTGRISSALQGLASQRVVADESIGMLRQVQEKGGLGPVQTHTELLPFAQGVFERVIMVDALHHVANQEKTARELCRVLQPGGKLLVVEPDVRMFAVKMMALAEKLFLMRSHFLSHSQIAQLFDCPDCQTRVEKEGINTYIIVEKMSGGAG